MTHLFKFLKTSFLTGLVFVSSLSLGEEQTFLDYVKEHKTDIYFTAFLPKHKPQTYDDFTDFTIPPTIKMTWYEQLPQVSTKISGWNYRSVQHTTQPSIAAAYSQNLTFLTFTSLCATGCPHPHSYLNIALRPIKNDRTLEQHIVNTIDSYIDDHHQDDDVNFEVKLGLYQGKSFYLLFSSHDLDIRALKQKILKEKQTQ